MVGRDSFFYVLEARGYLNRINDGDEDWGVICYPPMHGGGGNWAPLKPK